MTARLAALMDGLAIQLALADPAMTPARFVRLWLEAASWSSTRTSGPAR